MPASAAAYGRTVIVPDMRAAPWISQKNCTWPVEGREKLTVPLAPLARVPVVGPPVIASVCGGLSLFVTFSVSCWPARTVIGLGAKLKLLIVTLRLTGAGAAGGGAAGVGGGNEGVGGAVVVAAAAVPP